jgi:hypothetical protein
MRILMMIVVCVLVLGGSVCGQVVQVFGLDDKRLARGRVVATTDTSVVLRVSSDLKEFEIRAEEIGWIRMRKRYSLGRCELIAVPSGLVLGRVLAATLLPKEDYWFRGLDVFSYTVAGGILGAATGGVVAAVQPRRSIYVFGNVEQWSKERVVLGK